MRIGLLLAFSFLSINLGAQLESYNFQDFRQATFENRSLIITPRLSGRHNFYQRESNSFSDYSSSRQNIGGNINISMGSISNSPDKKYTKGLYASTSPSFEYLKTADTSTFSRTAFHNSLSYYQNVKHYKDYNKMFFGWYGSTGGTHSYESEKEEIRSIEESHKGNVASARLQLGFQIGLGRVENISNAWHAVRIINRMMFTEITSNDPPHELINAFGQEIDRIKAQRVYDYRLGYQMQLAQIDAFLYDEIGLDRTDLKYYLELNDMWRFGISEHRILGNEWEFRIGLNSDITTSKHKVTDTLGTRKSDRLTTDYGPEASITFTSGNPIKQFSQLNFIGKISASQESIRSEITNQTSEQDNVVIKSYLQILYAYYPTTRTEYTTSLYGSHTFNKFEFVHNNDKMSQHQFYLGARLEGVYWLNWRSTLTYGIGASWSDTSFDFSLSQRTQQSQDIKLDYGIVFRHALY